MSNQFVKKTILLQNCKEKWLGYGHTQAYSNHQTTCVKSSDNYLPRECQKNKNTPANCALCTQLTIKVVKFIRTSKYFTESLHLK